MPRTGSGSPGQSPTTSSATTCATSAGSGFDQKAAKWSTEKRTSAGWGGEVRFGGVMRPPWQRRPVRSIPSEVIGSASMPDYLLLFVGLGARPTATDDQTVDYNRQWTEYMSGLGQAGKLRGGAPLEPTGKVVTREGAADFAPEKVDIGGYIVLAADTLDEAAEIASRAPHTALGGSTIVRPCAAVA